MSKKHFIIENNIIKAIKKPFNANIVFKHDKHNFGYELFNSFTNNVNRVAQIQVESEEQRTYAQIKDSTIRCALWLKKQKIGSGDIISLCTYNQLDACIPLVATLYVGAVFNAWYHNIDLETARHFMSLVQPKVIFACESSLNILLEAAKLENGSTKIIVFGTYPGLESLADILSVHSHEGINAFRPQEIHNPQDAAIILFSSGTTGFPKAVTYSYDSLLENTVDFGPHVTCVSLWYSGFSCMTGVLLPLKSLISGSTIIMHTTWDPEEACKVIDKYKVSYIFFTPGLMTQCCKVHVFDRYDLQSLKVITTGSLPLNENIYKSIKKKFPNATMIHRYGLTEFGNAVTFRIENFKRIDSAGFVGPATQLKVIDIATGHSLGPNKTGEICAKSSRMMIGYYKNPTATKKAIDEEGWLHTGDIGYYNEDGEVFVTDRLKELIKYRDHYISPSEIEQVLLNHPGVMQVAVIPLPHKTDGERPMAFVKKVPGAQVIGEELIELSSRLEDYKKLRGGVKFMDDLPHTSTNKICRPMLKQVAKNYDESSMPKTI